MVVETIDLYEYFKIPRGGAKGGYLTAYHHGVSAELGKRIRPAILVIPGGAYAMVSDSENEPVAMRFFAAGFEAFALQYSVAPECYPAQILQAGMAMMYIRREAAAMDLNGRVAAVGFSAGGHLCGCISLLWDDPALVAAFGREECEKIRPDASIFSYAVITNDEPFGHGDSIRNFCGTKANRADYSLEKRARPSDPPCFIWSTSADAGVPAENSVMLYSALRAVGVSAELHIFEKGCHGMSVCTAETNCAEPSPSVCRHNEHWVELAIEFLAEHGFVMRKAQ